MTSQEAAGDEFRSLCGVSPLLTDAAVSTALTDWFHEPVTFTHWEYAGDTGKGDAYLSEVIRIRVLGRSDKGELRRVQLVVKTIPRSIARRLTFRSEEFFRNEINFYRRVLPALRDLELAHGVDDPERHARLFLAVSDGVHDAVCLEDASLAGFAPAVRQEGVDLVHCTVALRALARFHAASFALRDQRPEPFEEVGGALTEQYYSERLRGWYERFWARIGAIAVDAVAREYPGTEYERKVRQFCAPERYSDMIRAATGTHASGVVSHGDCWTNNFLFRYSAGEATDALMIDFQLARVASPVLDVSFFVYACTTQELRRRHYPALLRLYHEELSARVRLLGSDPARLYPWEMFADEVKRYSYFGLAFSFESTPFIVLEPDDAVDMEVQGDQKLNVDDVWRVQPFKRREHRLREADNVVHAVDNGYI